MCVCVWGHLEVLETAPGSVLCDHSQQCWDQTQTSYMQSRSSRPLNHLPSPLPLIYFWLGGGGRACNARWGYAPPRQNPTPRPRGEGGWGARLWCLGTTQALGSQVHQPTGPSPKLLFLLPLIFSPSPVPFSSCSMLGLTPNSSTIRRAQGGGKELERSTGGSCPSFLHFPHTTPPRMVFFVFCFYFFWL